MPQLPDGRVLWRYRDSATGRQATLALEPLDWMSRFLQHILPSYFARVRTFGWLHPAAKVRANRVRALLGEKPLLTPAEQQAWLPPELDDLEAASPEAPPAKACSTPLCPRCRTPMRRLAGFSSFPLLYPNRPP